MIIKRIIKRDFTIVANDCFRDNRLSAESLGVICYLRSKPADWNVMPSELGNRFDCGRDRMQRILKELIGLGYIRKIRERDPITKAWKASEYIVLDTVAEPLPENTLQVEDDGKPVTGNLSLAEPLRQDLPQVLTPLLNTDSTKNGLKEQNTDEQSTARETRLVTAADWPADYADVFWSRYPNKKSKGHALKALEKIASAGKTRFSDLIAGLERYINSRDVQRGFVKHPATWLNGQCWKDEEQSSPLPVERPKSFFEVASEAYENANGARTGNDGGW